MTKLSPTSQALLDAAPFEATFWGGELTSRLPAGTKTHLNILVSRGLLKAHRINAFTRRYVRTDAQNP